jgi:hypothetical protein
MLIIIFNMEAQINWSPDVAAIVEISHLLEVSLSGQNQLQMDAFNKL